MNKITLLLFTALISFCGYAQLAEEGFEGPFPPPGWAVINVAGPNFTWAHNDPDNNLQPAYEGDYAAYLQRENVASGTSEDWLVTPQFTTPPFPQLRFFSRLTISGNQGTTYQIRISDNPDQLLQSEYDIIQTWTETEINPTQETYFEKIVDIPASYVGQPIYVAFVMLGDNGDRWLIDNVSVVEQCQNVVAQVPTGITENSAALEWTNPGNETNWEIELILATEPFTGVPNITYSGLPPYTALGLLPGTGYKYKVRAVCEPGQYSDWSNPVNFTTLFEPPVNDDCANAIALTVNPTNVCTVATAGTVNAATASPEPSTCAGTEDDDVWYTFVATNTTHLVSLINISGSSTNLDHVVYSGSCGTLTQLYCSAANNSTATGLTIGETYTVRVYSWSASAQTTNFDICIGTPPPPPANDECAGATAVPVNADLECGVFATGTIYSATASPDANTCTGTDDDDVWFSFVATNEQHTINLNNITGGTTLLNHVVYSGACGSLTELYCSDPNNSIAGNLTIGETYFIRVYSSTSTAGQTSVFDVCIGTPPPPPVNDDCDTPTVVPVNPDLVCTQTAPGTIAWATPSTEGDTGCTGTEDDDVWFEFVATSTTHTISLLNITGGTTLLNHIVYSGDCATTLTQLYCSDPNSSIAGNLTIGNSYKIRVYSSSAIGGQTSVFDVCVGTPPPPPVNDECSAAIVAPVNPDLSCAQTVPGTIAWSTPSIEPSTCTGTEDDDVWYEFVATNAVHTINLNNVTGSTTDLNHALYEGTDCGTMTQLYCATPNNSVAGGLTIGNTYKLRIYSSTATGGQTTNFDVCIGTPPPPPANDDCTAAIVAPVNPDLLCGQVVSGTIAWATASPEASTCTGTEDDDVWFEFVATNTMHTINFNNVVGSDLNHALYTGDCGGTITQLYCNAANNSVAQNLTIGQTYKVRVYTSTATVPQTTTFDLCIGTPPPPPANDDCAAATVVPINPTQVCDLVTPGTIAWSTASPEASTCTGTEDDDVWYQFTATNTTHLISFLNVSGSDINHALYTGDECGALITQVYCNAANNSTASGLTIGQVYKIRVYSSSATYGQTTTFDVCVGTPPPPPANDECAAAIPVPVNPTMECAQTVAGIVYSATQSPQATTCTVTPDDDVWFEFVATNNAHIISLLNIAGSSTNMYHALYEGDECGSLTQLLCSDANLSIAQNLTVGTTYKIRVWSNLTTPQTTEFEVCVATPPTPGTNDECASSIVVPVNQNSTCELFASGTVFGATASAEPSTCGGTEDDDVWFEFVATHTNHLVSIQNIEGTTTAINHALYQGDVCGSLTQLYCSTTQSINATNLTIGDTYKIRVFSSASTVQAVTFDVCVRIPNNPITVDEDLYTVPQLVSEVLIDSDCALVSNVTWSTGSNFGAANGIGYFDAATSDFPFENGVILATGSINEAVPGGAAGSGTGWPGDDQLNAIVLAADPTQDNGLENATILEFDFVPLTNQFTFDFLFASNEYGTFQCGYTDAFAFILTGPAPSTASQNLAVIPGTSIPVSVTTIRNGQHNANCESQNEEYFAQYNADDPLAAAIDYNGQTVPMQASADVVPGELYHIKMVIADYSDTAFNSAVFLGGGSFDIGDVDLGGDLLISDGTALCDEETVTLNTGLAASDFTFVWEKDDVVIPTATGPSLTVTEPGVYSVVASFPNVACSYQGEVTIEFYPDVEEVTGEPADLTYCDASGFHAFDLTVNTDAILAPLADPDAFTVDYYLTEADALADSNPIINFTNFTNTVPDNQTIYVRILNQEGGCIGIKSFELIIQDLTPEFNITDDLSLCGDEIATITVTPINFDPTSPDVGIVWTYNGTTLPDTGTSITTQGAGTYEVTINNTECTATATVNVTVSPTPDATINYADSPYCSNETTGTVTLTGDTGGTYTSTAGLVIDPATGAIDIAASDPGTYTVTYTIPSTPTCTELITTAPVEIVEAPNAVISYAGTPYCSDEGIATVTQTGTTGGTYSSAAGLVIDPATGEIDLGASTAGTYTVTYTVAATADCAGDSFTTEVTITTLPVATISYAGTPYCSNAGTATVTQTGNTGGTYSSTEGLVINPATGEIDLAASTGGNYVVTYTIAAANGCPPVPATANVTITTLPDAEFTYDSPTYCQNEPSAIVPTFNGAAVAGTFTATPAGLTIDPATGVIIASTSAPGTYTVTNLIAAANGCGPVSHPETITIIPAPVGTFTYAATAYCQEEDTNPSPILDGVAGTFSATPEGLSINSSTGEINLADSQPGTYTVVNTVDATAECPPVEWPFVVTINATPVFTFAEGCDNNIYELEVVPVEGSFDPDTATITWSGGAFTGSGAVIQPSEAVEYTVTVISGDCEFTDSFTVNSTSCFIQKGISPGDGDKNDTFDLSALNVTRLSIFNRYGQEVFSYGNYTNQWGGQDNNGNELPSGTYYYSIERANGETKTGWVYINRQN